MYDIEKDVENVAKAIADSFAVPTPAIYFKETARAAINASSAVKELKELQERYDALQTSWVNYKSDMRPETRNDFLRKCSNSFDITPPKED